MKNSLLRNQLAQRILTLRAIQRGTRPIWCLSRPFEMRVLATVHANASLHTIFHQLLLAEADEAADVDASAAAPLQHALDKFGSITLVARTQRVPWEDYTEDVLDLTDEVPASDAYYARHIEQLWTEHLAHQARTSEAKESLALYLQLKARFEPTAAHLVCTG